MSPVAHFLWLSRPHPATNTSARSVSRKSFIWDSQYCSKTLVDSVHFQVVDDIFKTKHTLESGRHMGWTRPGTSFAGRRSLIRARSFCFRWRNQTNVNVFRQKCSDVFLSSYLVLLALNIFVVNDDLRWLEPGEEVGWVKYQRFLMLHMSHRNMYVLVPALEIPPPTRDVVLS